MGIEPTKDPCEPHTGFEDQGHHQAPVTSKAPKQGMRPISRRAPSDANRRSERPGSSPPSTACAFPAFPGLAVKRQGGRPAEGNRHPGRRGHQLGLVDDAAQGVFRLDAIGARVGQAMVANVGQGERDPVGRPLSPAALAPLAKHCHVPTYGTRPRLGVNRAFSAGKYGTVVAGIPVSGIGPPRLRAGRPRQGPPGAWTKSSRPWPGGRRPTRRSRRESWQPAGRLGRIEVPRCACGEEEGDGHLSCEAPGRPFRQKVPGTFSPRRG